MMVAVTGFWCGLHRRSPGMVAVGVLILGASAHMSPLAVLVVPGCLAIALGREHRWVFRNPLPLAAGGMGLLLAAPLVVWMRQTPITSGHQPSISLADGVPRAAYMMLQGFSGENTVRHFTNGALPADVALAVALVLAAVLFASVAALARAKPEEPAAREARFGLWLLTSAMVLLPLLLAPARQWHMPTIDGDRYAFVLLPGLGLSLAALRPG